MKARWQDRNSRPLRAAFIANGNALDESIWSGTPFHMRAALENHFHITAVIQQPWARWYRPLGRFLKVLSGMQFEYSWSRWYSSLAFAATRRRLLGARPDVVFAIATTDMTYLFVDDLPVVSITDAVMTDLVNYYGMYQCLPEKVKRRAIQCEREAFDKSVLVHVPSRWAAESATRSQNIPRSRIVEIPWGANMPIEPRRARTLRDNICRLLFVGGDWTRKGGPIALDTVVELNKRGISCTLDVVGCRAKDVLNGPVPENVTFHGFIDKRDQMGLAKLESLYARATLFILPSLAEAWGIVFAEAAHQGLPVIAFATGGVTSVVEHGKTGILIPEGGRIENFADEIQAIIYDPDRYANLSRNALKTARERLNWDVWATTLHAGVAVTLSNRG
jgi:glycosyltransferase involved in cell wall biosynthesis